LRPLTGLQAYWRDVGTIDSFWEANMELIGVTRNSISTTPSGRWTTEQSPPGKFVFDDEGRRHGGD
jgi:glucose-1-phosphate adenylyltransferase